MEGMGKHMAKRHPGAQGKMEVMLMFRLVSPLKMTLAYDIGLNELKEERVMVQRLKKCAFCGLLGGANPHYEFSVRPCKVMLTRLKECCFCGVLGCVTQHLVISSDCE